MKTRNQNEVTFKLDGIETTFERIIRHETGNDRWIGCSDGKMYTACGYLTIPQLEEAFMNGLFERIKENDESGIPFISNKGYPVYIYWEGMISKISDTAYIQWKKLQLKRNQELRWIGVLKLTWEIIPPKEVEIISIESTDAPSNFESIEEQVIRIRYKSSYPMTKESDLPSIHIEYV